MKAMFGKYAILFATDSDGKTGFSRAFSRAMEGGVDEYIQLKGDMMEAYSSDSLYDKFVLALGLVASPLLVPLYTLSGVTDGFSEGLTCHRNRLEDEQMATLRKGQRVVNSPRSRM